MNYQHELFQEGYNGLRAACYWPCWQRQGDLLLSNSLVVLFASAKTMVFPAYPFGFSCLVVCVVACPWLVYAIELLFLLQLSQHIAPVCTDTVKL